MLLTTRLEVIVITRKLFATEEVINSEESY